MRIQSPHPLDRVTALGVSLLLGLAALGMAVSWWLHS